MVNTFENPFRPGAGHMPPYLAGRNEEQEQVRKLLTQQIILENLVLTGLRGVGKTVLLETLKPIALQGRWLWVGTDLSESSSLTEERLATRLLTDISVKTSSLIVEETTQLALGFGTQPEARLRYLDFETLAGHFSATPGLVSDKLKSTLELVWQKLRLEKLTGVVFAYDEAQNLADHAAKNEYPMLLLLEVFQSLQRKGIPFMLILAGLPTLFPKLVKARTYAERMFHIIFLQQLGSPDARDAIVKPIEDEKCPITFSDPTVQNIGSLSGGYPYFIQFICREIFDAWIQRLGSGVDPAVPAKEIIQKLDDDFFAGRWARATDRQRDLLAVIAHLPNCDMEFTVQEIVSAARQRPEKGFSPSHVNQMLASLGDAGLVYKNRHGKYSLAVPLLSQFIRRQIE